jgi:hypothetical protein
MKFQTLETSPETDLLHVCYHNPFKFIFRSENGLVHKALAEYGNVSRENYFTPPVTPNEAEQWCKDWAKRHLTMSLYGMDASKNKEGVSF